VTEDIGRIRGREARGIKASKRMEGEVKGASEE